MKSNRVYLVFLIWLFSGVSVALAARSAVNRQTDEYRVTALISALPEIKAYLQKNKNLQPQVILYHQPGPGFPYYWVKVGISNEDKFWPSYHFYVEAKTNKILYKDMMTNGLDPKNALITLEQWRRYRSTTGFMKMHTYKNGKLVVLNGQ